jgi:hypothetical protein
VIDDHITSLFCKDIYLVIYNKYWHMSRLGEGDGEKGAERRAGARGGRELKVDGFSSPKTIILERS